MAQLTAGKIIKAADGDHIEDGYDAVTSVGSPGTDTNLPTEKAVRDALNLKAASTHAANHTDGTDNIQLATAAQKGLMSLAYAGKLDGIEAAADVTDAANVATAGAVMATLADAKGDIIAATGDNAVTRLPVGSDGKIIVADAAQTEGMQWKDDEVELWFEPGLTRTAIANIIYTNVAAAGGSGYIFAHAPFNFKALTSMDIIFAPAGTNAAANIDVAISYGTVGETMLQHTASDTTSTYNITVNINFALSISALFTVLAANDFISIQITNNAAFALYLFGVRMRYTRNNLL